MHFSEALENTPFTIFCLKMMLKSGIDFFLHCYMRKSCSTNYFYFLEMRPYLQSCKFNNKNLMKMKKLPRGCFKKVDWAKYHIKHSSKSIRVIKLSFCQNDSPMGGPFWQKDSLITYILFALLPILVFSPVANLMHHPLTQNPEFERIEM